MRVERNHHLIGLRSRFVQPSLIICLYISRGLGQSPKSHAVPEVMRRRRSI